MNEHGHCWAVVPAAGIGRRMEASVPKQYLRLGARLVIDYTLGRLLDHPRIEAVAVSLGAQDRWWPDSAYGGFPGIIRAPGGAERCHSVLNGLTALRKRAAADDWVLVHDAARPCLRRSDIDLLLDRLAGHPVGGLLGVPVRDTMKRTDPGGVIEQTVVRDNLWHAYTPQMFRFAMLRDALEQALRRELLVTDEASAMELAGYRPVMIEGHSDNIKITRPQDLALAAFFLVQQEG